MWQRFTERARKVVFYAQEEAQKFGEGFVSTEHLLLGLVREDDSSAVAALQSLGVNQKRVREETVKLLPQGSKERGSDMTLTPRAKRVIDLAYDEARNLNDNYIGTEHLLLGLIREGDGTGGRVLAKLGVETDALRRAVIALPGRTRDRSQPPLPKAVSPLFEAVRARFGFGRSPSADVADAGIETENAAIWERATSRARAVITRAQEDATARGAVGIAAEHLILALMDDPECRGMKAIAGLKPDLARIRRAAEALASIEPVTDIPSPMPFAASGQNAITAAQVASVVMKNVFLGTEHLALVLFGGAAGEFADPEALDPTRVREAIARSQAEE